RSSYLILSRDYSCCAIALLPPCALARHHPATFSDNATSPRSAATSDRDTHRVPSVRVEDRSQPPASVSPASRDLYSLKPDPALPSAILNRNPCGETIPLQRWIPPTCSSRPRASLAQRTS